MMNLVEKIKIAGNGNAFPEVLNELAGDENWEIRCLVAANANASVEALFKLAYDRNEQVRKKRWQESKCPC